MVSGSGNSSPEPMTPAKGQPLSLPQGRPEGVTGDHGWAADIQPGQTPNPLPGQMRCAPAVSRPAGSGHGSQTVPRDRTRALRETADSVSRGRDGTRNKSGDSGSLKCPAPGQAKRTAPGVPPRAEARGEPAGQDRGGRDCGGRDRAHRTQHDLDGAAGRVPGSHPHPAQGTCSGEAPGQTAG